MLTAVRKTFPEVTSGEPPFDVRQLASKRAIVAITSVQMKLDGRILWVPGSGYLVELNKSHSEGRKRFTCAHEIGHTFFFDLDGEFRERARAVVLDQDLESSQVDSQEEALCNLAAAEVLMPYETFSAALRSLGPSARTILELSRTFRTSVWSTARRFVQLSPFRLVVALWDYQHEFRLYRTAWVAGHETKHQRHKLLVGPNVPIFTCFQSENRFRGRRWVSLGGPIDDYFVDGVALEGGGKRRILTVFLLERMAEKIIKRHTFPVLAGGQLRLF